METKIVTYYRISTTKQGLGIEAQKSAVSDYLAKHPEMNVIGSFTETFTGKEENRPEFQKALELCKRSGATLLAAKLDRIGRGKFLYSLMGNTSIKFKALDITGDSELERAIRIGVAIDERKTLSCRTSSALQAKANFLFKAKECYESGDLDEAKKFVELAELKSRNKRGLEWWSMRNFKLGSTHKLSNDEKANNALYRIQEANNDVANINASKALKEYLIQGGLRNYSHLANYLNENNYRTRRGKSGWKPQSVKNLMDRFYI